MRWYGRRPGSLPTVLPGSATVDGKRGGVRSPRLPGGGDSAVFGAAPLNETGVVLARPPVRELRFARRRLGDAHRYDSVCRITGLAVVALVSLRHGYGQITLV